MQDLQCKGRTVPGNQDRQASLPSGDSAVLLGSSLCVCTAHAKLPCLPGTHSGWLPVHLRAHPSKRLPPNIHLSLYRAGWEQQPHLQPHSMHKKPCSGLLYQASCSRSNYTARVFWIPQTTAVNRVHVFTDSLARVSGFLSRGCLTGSDPESLKGCSHLTFFCDPPRPLLQKH